MWAAHPSRQAKPQTQALRPGALQRTNLTPGVATHPPPLPRPADKLRRSSLHQFLERCSTHGSSDSAPPTSAAPTGPAAPGPAAPGASSAAGAGAGTLVVAPSANSAGSDSAAVAALAAALAGQGPPRSPEAAGAGAGGADLWAGVSGSSLSEGQQALLAQVDLDYLHSFGWVGGEVGGWGRDGRGGAGARFAAVPGPARAAAPPCPLHTYTPSPNPAPHLNPPWRRSFDALGVPLPLLPAYVCAMFLELGLASFG